ncbi:MAG: hypothetical protein U0Z44_07110 [Kouleothrix sp.]
MPHTIFNDRSLVVMLPFQSYRHYQKHAEAIERWLAAALPASSSSTEDA